MLRVRAGRQAAPGVQLLLTLVIFQPNDVACIPACHGDRFQFHSSDSGFGGKAFALICHELKQHQRSDLLPIASESRLAWLARLEGELLTMVRAVAMPPPVQIVMGEHSAKSFGKVEFDMPA